MPDVILTGPEGRLEGRYHPSKDSNARVALMLHPHPLYGGTMNNKIVYSLYKSFAKQGFNVLRFNFRGVGKSQGRFDRGEGELSDAASALDWLQTTHPNASGFWVAGFSFGAWIAMQLMMRRPEVNGFIAVAPPANMYDFSFLAPCPASGMIIQGDADKVVPIEYVNKLIKKLSQQKGITIDYKTIPGADHFFKDHLNDLGVLFDNYLASVEHTRQIQQPKKRRMVAK
ncbi:MAG: alpha/beta hydrolase [Alphaproteobacteria bacterium]|nr:alpha/beta hydrolase [Alphaproteobacteria bacterium]